MTALRHSRQEKLLFSESEDNFPTFLEQFEARDYALGLSDCLLDRLKVTSQKDVQTNDERFKRYMEGAALAKLQDTVNFISGHKPNGTASWAALTKRHNSTVQHRVQSPMTQLTGIKLTSGKEMAAYVTKAKGLNLDLIEAREAVSDDLITGLIIKVSSQCFLECGDRRRLRRSLGQLSSHQVLV